MVNNEWPTSVETLRLCASRHGTSATVACALSSRAQRAALSTRVDCILETVSGRVLLQSCCNLPPETPFCRARVRCELQGRWHVRCATVHERMRQCERDER